MANIKSQIKRIKTNKKAEIRNKANKNEIKTYLKKFNLALSNKEKEEKVVILKNKLFSLLDSAITKKLFHKNKVNRLKSKVNLKFNSHYNHQTN